MQSRSLEQAPARTAVAERAPEPLAARPASPLLDLQRTHGNRFVQRLLGGVDGLTPTGELSEEIDGLVQRNGPDAGVGAPPPPVVNTAVPTNLVQTDTGWSGGATKYGLQVKFTCSSSSGSVADLVSRPGLVWNEYVTYSRNDFAHRIAPADPTIMPVPPLPFAGRTVLAPNSLSLDPAADTHFLPTSVVREADFTPPSVRTLPAVMESSQVYRYSTDGATWTNFAGPFTIRRTLYRTPTSFFGLFGGNLRFKTEKVGISTVDEAYKP